MENNVTEINESIVKLVFDYLEKTNFNINLSEKEWYAFFYVIESHFLANDIMSDYEHALNIIVRRAVYYARLEKELNIEALVKSLSDLLAFNIETKEIKAMQEEIRTFSTKEKKLNYVK